MKKKLLAILTVVVLCLTAAMPALAADVFKFAETPLKIFENEEVTPVLIREGNFANGEVVFTVDNTRVAKVTEDGTIIAVSKGNAKVTAALKKDGKTVRRAELQVQVRRRVTKVTLSLKGLTVYEPDDPILTTLMKERPEDAEPLTNPVIVIPAGKSAVLKAVCTPEDANVRTVEYATSDAGILRTTKDGNIRGVEKGECDLTVSSVQNPEVREIFHVVVIEPVKKIQIEAPDKTVFAGESMSLDAVCTPATASIQQVTWSSRNTSIATVDENGTVTGIKKGQTMIDAKATDGSNVVGSISIKVAQEVTEIQLKQSEVTVWVNRRVTLNANVLPREADNRSVTWMSSDESIATVQRGEVTGKKAGICIITCASVSNPSVTASAAVQVIQPVTKITFTSPNGLSFPVRTSQPLTWTVEPEDANIKDVTFKSSAPKVATVDANGVVTGVSRGSATITATSTDGSNRTGTIKVNIIQPVEGVLLPQQTYYVQLGRETTVKANVLPSNANNQTVYWEAGDPGIASVRSTGTNTGRVKGMYTGTTTVTAITEDGGFMASAGIRVADYDGAVRIESLQIQPDNKIRITLWNTSDVPVQKVYFRIDCFDTMNYPMVYNKDGVTTGFDGSYNVLMNPGDRSIHGQFNFGNYMETGLLGAVTMTITGYRFENGQEWWIPEEYQVPVIAYSGNMWTPTPTPMPAQDDPPAGE